MRNKLDNLYSEMEGKYNKNGIINEEEMKKDVELLNKQIMGMKASLSKTTDENKKKSLAEGIRKAEARKNNFEGYTKYHTQIDKIKDFKKSLSAKLTRLKAESKTAPKMLEKLNEELKVKNELGQDLNKKNKDEKYTTSLSNDEYNKLQENIEKTKKETEELKKKIEDLKSKISLYDKKIKEVEGKIGKCDLAWKTLFTNKGWDEIQRRAANDSKRYEAVKKEKDTGDNKPKAEKAVEEENKEPVKEKALATTKPSLFGRFRNVMKKAYNSVKEYFFGPDGNSGREYVSEERKTAIQEERKEAAERAKEEEEKKLATQKDKFLEGLRTSVDIDYKNKKEQAYNEKHTKTVNQNQTKTNSVDKEEELEK